MTSPVYPVFEGDGGSNLPKRPTASVDLGGLDFVDSVEYPPKDREILSATDYLQFTMSLERVARTIPMLRADVYGYAAMTPGTATTNVVSVNGTLTTANVTVERLALGKYRVTYPTGKLPTANSKPVAILLKGAGGTASAEVTAFTSTTVDVWTYNFGGALSNTDVYFTVEVY